MGEGREGASDPQKLWGGLGHFGVKPRRSSKALVSDSGPVVALGTAMPPPKISGLWRASAIQSHFFSPNWLQKIKIANSTSAFYCYLFCIPPVCSSRVFEAG